MVAVGLGEPGDLDGLCCGHDEELAALTLRQGQAQSQRSERQEVNTRRGQG